MTEKALSKKYHVFLSLHPTCLLLPVSDGCACTTGTMGTAADLPQPDPVP